MPGRRTTHTSVASSVRPENQKRAADYLLEPSVTPFGEWQMPTINRWGPCEVEQ